MKRKMFCGTVLVILSAMATVAADDEFNLHHLNVSVVASTVPGNGDINPYGVARVPETIGNLQEGHILVSNFNNSMNQQGTGTTIVDVAPDGATKLFAQIDPNALPGPCPGESG